MLLVGGFLLIPTQKLFDVQQLSISTITRKENQETIDRIKPRN